jgi:hypothetical protein
LPPKSEHDERVGQAEEALYADGAKRLAAANKLRESAYSAYVQSVSQGFIADDLPATPVMHR